MNRGDIRWYEDLEIPRRPVLILTRQAVVDRLTHLTGVPATTVGRDIPSEVPLGPDDGMPRDCVLSTDNIGQFRVSRFSDVITTLDVMTMRRVCAALAVSTGCEIL